MRKLLVLLPLLVLFISCGNSYVPMVEEPIIEEVPIEEVAYEYPAVCEEPIIEEVVQITSPNNNEFASGTGSQQSIPTKLLDHYAYYLDLNTSQTMSVLTDVEDIRVQAGNDKLILSIVRQYITEKITCTEIIGTENKAVYWKAINENNKILQVIVRTIEPDKIEFYISKSEGNIHTEYIEYYLCRVLW